MIARSNNRYFLNKVDRPSLLVVFALNKRYPSAEDDKEINPEKYNGPINDL